MTKTSQVFLGFFSFCVVLCGGGAYFLFHLLGDAGEGVSEIGDPRPARVDVLVRNEFGAPIAGARVEAFLGPPPTTRWVTPSSTADVKFTVTR